HGRGTSSPPGDAVTPLPAKDRCVTGAAVATAAAPPADDRQWFALRSEGVAGELGVDAHAGLPPAEATTRLERYGPNAFAATKTEPRGQAFVRQYRGPMQIVLLVGRLG